MTAAPLTLLEAPMLFPLLIALGAWFVFAVVLGLFVGAVIAVGNR